MTLRLAAAAGLVGLVGALPAPALDSWERTLEQVVPSVVALRVSGTRAFDTAPAGYGRATGFVVDADLGLILTNRHVVRPGPIHAVAVFLDHEEVEVRAVYRDPVHDFGFLRYDPEDVRFLVPRALPLAPESAHLGAEIRVVGNDAGEKLSILAGTLARLDRSAPRYGRGGYNDFNTFYFQAASSASGGSSGSPAIDLNGRVVALTAGASRRASSSFFLPLDRVVRALEYVRAGETVPRGTVQAIFSHRPYDELRRLGLAPELEEKTRRRHPEATGLLVVAEILAGGPSQGLLEPGDVLLALEDQPILGFVALEELLDSSVGRTLRFRVDRGGEALELGIPVQDLHAITPDSYLEAGASIFHPLSYQMARNHALPVRGVYLADAGYMLASGDVPRGAVITAVDGHPTPTLDSLAQVFEGLPDGRRVPLRFFHLRRPRNPSTASIRIDRRWFPMRRCQRNDRDGRWRCKEAGPPPSSVPAPPVSASLPRLPGRPARDLAPSLAQVRFHVPYRVDGVQGTAFIGTGLVVDAERGLVLVDRDTVPVALGDVQLSFGGSVEIPGRVLYLHPEHNLAVVSYDPARLGDTPVKSARLEPRELSAGDDLWMVGLTRSQQLISRATQVARVEALSLPLPNPPRFRDRNLAAVGVTDVAPVLGGVLADRKGRVLALWSSFSTQGQKRGARSFFAGIPTEILLDVVEPLRQGQPVGWRSLGVELGLLSLAEARVRGLPEGTAQQLEKHDPLRRRVLFVERLVAGTSAASQLRGGDLLVAVNGRPVTRHREVERAARGERATLRVIRDARELDLQLTPTPLTGRGVPRMILWAGAVLQSPPRALSTQRGLRREGVYVASRWRGSPAERHALPPTHRILAVNGRPTPDLDTFLEVVRESGGSAVRLATVDLDGRREALTLILDSDAWPTWELRNTPDGWRRTGP